MLVRDFNYMLPPEQIAQQPLQDRAASRMLVVDRVSGSVQDKWFRGFPDLLHPGDLLVLNDTRVLPARLFARRSGIHAQPISSRNPAAKEHLQGNVEVLLTEQHAPLEWSALVHPGRKIPVGERLSFFAPCDVDSGANAKPLLTAEIIGRGEFGERRLRFDPVDGFYAILDRIGHMPLPPYIHRADDVADRERYQTVFASERGSAAAPTAGLHFTPEILSAIRARGVEIGKLTLHVGLGTFQPVRVEKLEDIRLHTERYTLPQSTAKAVNLARREGRRVIAVGTTTVRTLEHCARTSEDGELRAHSGETNMFISPGYEFRVVGGLLTNFHLPQSTLLMLVCAFAGTEKVLAAYKHAVAEGYRFFSYGDCMFLA
ncbi:MAG TPA: tRNA preQ1(34) S-adenosylmethionine ribosyltransferase-isomerase QueA [Acidobacteriaceae bacterium]|nr:tRNA preQ1(34) S-adenosylmethionine ribosyltransferase-isomerase QueA [Acidobacteriaceae bacterium]